jgi:hypothetical protein
MNQRAYDHVIERFCRGSGCQQRGQRTHEASGTSPAEPTVRILFPPAESPYLAGFRPPTSRSPAFPAGVRGGGGGAVDRDGRGAVTWRRLVGISLSGHIPVPLCSRCGSQQCQHWPASEVRLPRGVTISVSFSAQQLRQSRARSAARASQAADVNAPAACLRSDRAAGVRRGWLR